MKPIITEYQARVAADFSSEKPCVENPHIGALRLMEKHMPKPPTYGLTEWERKRYELSGQISYQPPPIINPPRRKGDGSPESKAAFKEWLDVPEADRYKGLGTAIARKHGAVPQHVLNRISRWKKENNK